MLTVRQIPGIWSIGLVKQERRGFTTMSSHIDRRFWRERSNRVRIALAALATAGVAAAVVVGPLAAGSVASARTASAKAASAAPLVVWYDAARAAFVKEYKATHPGANIKWVLYSGDDNGDGTLQSKFALYNRVGWKPGVSPDVIFDEENYEAGWLGEPPFNDLLNLKHVRPEERYRATIEGLGDCTINGKLLCLRNDNAANVLWVNTDLWNQFFPASHLRPLGHSTRRTVGR